MMWQDVSKEGGDPWLLPTPSRPARQVQSLVPDILIKGAFPLDIHNSTSNITSPSNSSAAQAPGAMPRQLQSLVPDIVTKGTFPFEIHNGTTNTTSTSNSSAAQASLESPGAAPRQLQSLVPDIITKGTFSFTIHNGTANATAAVGDVFKEVRAADEARAKVLQEDRLRMVSPTLCSYSISLTHTCYSIAHPIPPSSLTRKYVLYHPSHALVMLWWTCLLPKKM